MSIKICVVVRVRDEERRIAQFCEAYEDADMILVGDGGSIDRTKEIAAQYPNVIIRDYPGRQEMKNGYWRNNDSDHANWMFKWGREYEPDWMIYDDCDCRPNYLLRMKYRHLLETIHHDVIMVTRLYLWGLKQHFPHLAKPEELYHRNYEPSLWAWRGSMEMMTVNEPPAYSFKVGKKPIKDFRKDTDAFDLLPPYCLLHYSWDDPERVMEKVKIYRESGLIPGQNHPLDFGGPLEDLPSFAHE